MTRWEHAPIIYVSSHGQQATLAHEQYTCGYKLSMFQYSYILCSHVSYCHAPIFGSISMLSYFPYFIFHAHVSMLIPWSHIIVFPYSTLKMLHTSISHISCQGKYCSGIRVPLHLAAVLFSSSLTKDSRSSG